MSADELKAKGNQAFNAKDYNEAIEWYSKAIVLNPTAESAGALYSNRAACWQGLSNFSKAVEDAEQCIKVRPTWLKGYVRKGLGLQGLKEYDEALKALKEAMKLEPSNEDVMEKLQLINNAIRQRNEKATPSGCKTGDEAKLIGNSLFSDGKYERATLFYTRAIELTPDSVEEKANYFANRAACNQQTHSYAQMVDDCNAALLINPKHVKALIRRGLAFEGMEKWKKALDDYKMVNTITTGISSVSQGMLRCERALRA